MIFFLNLEYGESGQDRTGAVGPNYRKMPNQSTIKLPTLVSHGLRVQRGRLCSLTEPLRRAAPRRGSCEGLSHPASHTKTRPIRWPLMVALKLFTTDLRITFKRASATIACSGGPGAVETETGRAGGWPARRLAPMGSDVNVFWVTATPKSFKKLPAGAGLQCP